MKYVSCRQGFDQVTGDPVDNAAWFGKPQAEPGEFIMVHGYNCLIKNAQDAYRANKTFAEESGFSGQKMVGYLWPGLGGSMLQTAEFHKAQSQADKAAVQLAKYVGDTKDVVIMAHSLGARVVLEAACYHGMKARLVVLIGAAVSHDCFNAQYKNAGANVDKVQVFYSNRDNVLARIFKLDQGLMNALGAAGPISPAPSYVEAVDVTAHVGAHGEYRFDRDIWAAVLKQIETQVLG